MRLWIVFLVLVGICSFIYRFTSASGGAEGGTPAISPRAVRIDAQLGIRLDAELPDVFKEDESFDARVVNPAKLMVLGMKGVRQGERVTLKVLSDGHFQVIRQQSMPYPLQLNPRGRVITTVPK
jgi:hypothetical protein